jgi:hypothetical protein
MRFSSALAPIHHRWCNGLAFPVEVVRLETAPLPYRARRAGERARLLHYAPGFESPRLSFESSRPKPPDTFPVPRIVRGEDPPEPIMLLDARKGALTVHQSDGCI